MGLPVVVDDRLLQFVHEPLVRRLVKRLAGHEDMLQRGQVVLVHVRRILLLQNTGGGVNVSYTLRDAATGGVVMTFSATQPAASFTQFDTAAFYLSKNASSANYNFIIKAVDVSLAGAN